MLWVYRVQREENWTKMIRCLVLHWPDCSHRGVLVEYSPVDGDFYYFKTGIYDKHMSKVFFLVVLAHVCLVEMVFIMTSIMWWAFEFTWVYTLVWPHDRWAALRWQVDHCILQCAVSPCLQYHYAAITHFIPVVMPQVKVLYFGVLSCV